MGEAGKISCSQLLARLRDFGGGVCIHNLLAAEAALADSFVYISVLPKKHDWSRASSHLQTDTFLRAPRYPLGVDKKSS